MKREANRPKFLTAYVGYCIFAGLVAYFLIYPMMDHVAQLVDPMHRHVFEMLKHIVSFVICFFIFRFLVTLLIVRPLMAKRSEEQHACTEQSAPGDSSRTADGPAGTPEQ